jgi:hypothetical protein
VRVSALGAVLVHFSGLHYRVRIDSCGSPKTSSRSKGGVSADAAVQEGTDRLQAVEVKASNLIESPPVLQN